MTYTFRLVVMSSSGQWLGTAQLVETRALEVCVALMTQDSLALRCGSEQDKEN